MTYPLLSYPTASALLALLSKEAVQITNNPAPTYSFQRGDANCDRAVDISDPTLTLSFLFNGAKGICCEDAADSDDSGAIDLSDAVRTLNYLFNNGAVPPAPSPPSTFGSDPSPDNLGCRYYPPASP
jgi:hypothetical protein